jgi:hypothetical protein
VLSDAQRQALKEPWRAKEILKDEPGGLEWWELTGKHMKGY